MLLVFLYAIGWKGGSIFPSFDEIRNPPADGIYKTHLTENDLYETLKPIYRDVLKRFEKLGVHCTRKTAYLFAALGGCTDTATMMQAAHHACPKVVTRYILDALNIDRVLKLFADSKQFVGNWSSCFSGGGENNVSAALPGAKWQRPLPEIVVGFVEQVLGVAPHHPQRFQPNFLFDLAIQWHPPQKDPSHSLTVSYHYLSPVCLPLVSHSSAYSHSHPTCSNS